MCCAIAGIDDAPERIMHARLDSCMDTSIFSLADAVSIDIQRASTATRAPRVLKVTRDSNYAGIFPNQ